MTSLWPGGPCDPCERDLHQKCIGWAKSGFDFCGCSKGLCGIRLVSRFMWDIDEPDQGDEP